MGQRSLVERGTLRSVVEARRSGEPPPTQRRRARRTQPQRVCNALKYSALPLPTAPGFFCRPIQEAGALGGERSCVRTAAVCAVLALLIEGLVIFSVHA